MIDEIDVPFDHLADLDLGHALDDPLLRRRQVVRRRVVFGHVCVHRRHHDLARCGHAVVDIARLRMGGLGFRDDAVEQIHDRQPVGVVGGARDLRARVGSRAGAALRSSLFTLGGALQRGLLE